MILERYDERVRFADYSNFPFDFLLLTFDKPWKVQSVRLGVIIDAGVPFEYQILGLCLFSYTLRPPISLR